MPAFIGQMGVMLGGIVVNMAAQLVTERFLKRMIVRGLQAAVDRTETEEDNALLDDAKRAWGVED